MKKRLLSIAFTLLCFFMISAAGRTPEQALELAKSFLSQADTQAKRQRTFTASDLRLSYQANEKNTSSNPETLFYVFNIGSDEGFVIVSGDDSATNILGYADEGQFDINTIPDNFRYWLSFYEEEINSIKRTNISAFTSAAPVYVINNNFAEVITPLIKTKWNQGVPYNNDCPVIPDGTESRSKTGCVATAMAQMMKYHEWPERGIGSNSYVTKTYKIQVNADFSNTTYNWDKMQAVHTSTTENNDAVSELMFHCGVSADMDYGYSSGANTRNMAQALIENFNYDENLQYRSRDYYEREEWESIIKEELNQSRPVFYRGNSASGGGHLFLLDGYDINDMFHINWGWGGTSDGYFVLSALNPKSIGIGGGSGGYNFNQEIVVGVQKPNDTSTPSYQVLLREGLSISAEAVNRSEEFTVTAKQLRNWGVNNFTGRIGVALYQNGVLKYNIGYRNITNDNPLPPTYGWTSTDFKATIPSSILNGEYKLYLVYKGSDESDYSIIRGKVGTINYLNANVTTSSITFSLPTDEMPALSLKSMQVSGNLYQNKNGRFTITIENQGKEYNSVLSVLLKSETNGEITDIIPNIPVNIAKDETKEIILSDSVNVMPGQYNLSVYFDKNNNPSNAEYVQLGTSSPVTVLNTPAELPKMTVTKPVFFQNANSVDKNNAVLTAHIKNTGGLFDNIVIAFVYPDASSSSLTSYGRQHLILDKNEEAVITFSGYIDLEPGDYFTAIRYRQENTTTWGRFSPLSDASTEFTLVEQTSGIKDMSVSGIVLYPNPVKDILHIQSEHKIESLKIIDLSGKIIHKADCNAHGASAIPVSELRQGLYLIRLNTEGGSFTGKFLKTE